MRTSLFIILVISSCTVAAQEQSNGRNLVTNFKSFEIGYAYPLLTRGPRYATLIETHFNYGLKTAFTWGRLYDSGFSVSISPALLYVFVPHTIHLTQNYSRNKEVAITYHNVSWSLPVFLERTFFFKSRLGVGLAIGMPVWSTGKYNEFDIDLFFLPKKDNDWTRDKPYARLSFLLKSTFPLFQTETRQNFISFEYLHYLHYNRETNSDEKLFNVTFIHRQLKIKEKRFKWDRALVKKDRND